MPGNSNLHDSSRNKQDEFYTNLQLVVGEGRQDGRGELPDAVRGLQPPQERRVNGNGGC